jgi:endonuclease/exonuclease/phosphatase family metal-dependent hydrolase
MQTKIRIATFNVENLFSRAKLLDLDDHSVGDQLLAKVGQLEAELKKSTYDKPRIVSLYSSLQDYITFVETRGKLLNRKGSKITVAANGPQDWLGWIQFKPDKFSDPARANTAKVIEAVNADITCLVEIESRLALKEFASEHLTGQYAYPHNMLVEGNDARGINVAILSRHPIQRLRSHIDDRDGKSLVFSRDCLEVQLQLADGRSLSVLLNHFKSRGYGSVAKNDERRKLQADWVAEKILKTQHNLQSDWVVVAGDFNDTPDSTPLRSLLTLPNLHDVLALKYPNPGDRWTYHYEKNEQIDYLLVSEPLRQAWQDAGVERRGIYQVNQFTSGAVQPFPTVTNYKSSASDHGSVWAEFLL